MVLLMEGLGSEKDYVFFALHKVYHYYFWKKCGGRPGLVLNKLSIQIEVTVQDSHSGI